MRQDLNNSDLRQKTKRRTFYNSTRKSMTITLSVTLHCHQYQQYRFRVTATLFQRTLFPHIRVFEDHDPSAQVADARLKTRGQSTLQKLFPNDKPPSHHSMIEHSAYIYIYKHLLHPSEPTFCLAQLALQRSRLCECGTTSSFNPCKNSVGLGVSRIFSCVHVRAMLKRGGICARDSPVGQFRVLNSRYTIG